MLESPSDGKETKPVYPKGNEPCITKETISKGKRQPPRMGENNSK